MVNECIRDMCAHIMRWGWGRGGLPLGCACSSLTPLRSFALADWMIQTTFCSRRRFGWCCSASPATQRCSTPASIPCELSFTAVLYFCQVATDCASQPHRPLQVFPGEEPGSASARESEALGAPLPGFYPPGGLVPVSNLSLSWE